MAEWGMGSPAMAFQPERTRMVETQIAAHGVRDPRVLSAMERVERHRFVRPEDLARAYEDGALPIGQGQTISQPYMVAKMSELLALAGPERVLEIGTGSGYQTAVLAELAREVFTVERIPTLSGRAQEILRGMGYANIRFRIADGSLGWPEHAPFDRILVTAGAPEPPGTLLDQLAPGGTAVIPVGDERGQTLRVITRDAEGRLATRSSVACVFVKLIGQEGWRAEG